MLLRIIFTTLFFVSSNAFAQFFTNQFSFAPPPTDASITYLADIFGNVDGIISGTGSQLFGKMMGIFNSAVLALGSIIMFYTILVGTMHTAHEGEFLGKKWSSVWIPIRAAIGISLLAPKASGYCLVQIFIMWVVVQGVGAADKVWNSALDYLNQGGKIVQAQMDSKTSTSPVVNNGQGNPNYIGAVTILTGQVCMLGLQRMIETQRNNFLVYAQANPDMGPCGNQSSDYQQWQEFCTSDVPDFLASVNAIQFQKDKQLGFASDTSAKNYQMNMPNFPETAPAFYRSLNGICGSIYWNDPSNLSDGSFNLSDVQMSVGLNASQVQTLILTRAIAIQEMYNFLSNIAQQMLQNDPQLNVNITANPDTDASPVAVMQYGFSMKNYITPCNTFSESCQLWSSPQGTTGVLFAGNEFLNAINAYNGVMMPILNMVQQFELGQQTQNLREFVSKTQTTGWMFAGSYFFDLVALSGSPVSNTNLTDSKSGLQKSTMFNLTLDCESNTTPDTLCWFLQEVGKTPVNQPVQQIETLIDGHPNATSPSLCSGTTLSLGSYKDQEGYITPIPNLSSITCASTTLGYIGNSYFLYVPGQPGATPPQLPDFEFPSYNLQNIKVDWDIDVPCGGINLWLFKICLGQVILKPALWLGENIVNALLSALEAFGVNIFDIMVVSPLKNTIWPTLQQAYETITTPSANPIVNIANMGGFLINSTINEYMSLLAFAVIGAIPFVGTLVLTLYAFALPLYTAWMVLFLSIGFSAAYYAPLLPYIIFTFGAISWLIAVIESMVAGPIMALGIMSPEGEGVLGRSEQGFMILVNVFLRPSMMIIGFVTAIAMTYVSVWILNEGFGNAAQFLISKNPSQLSWGNFVLTQVVGMAFYIFIYISLYTTVVQKSFNLIYILPDKVLRWVGGQPESYGSETQQWLDETRQKVEQQFAAKTEGGMGEGFKQMSKKSEKDEKKEDKKDDPHSIK